MHPDTDKDYEPTDDPDAGTATTPGEIATDDERDQAEGDDDASASDTA